MGGVMEMNKHSPKDFKITFENFQNLLIGGLEGTGCVMFDICRVKNSYTCAIQVDTDLDLKKTTQTHCSNAFTFFFFFATPQMSIMVSYVDCG